MSDDLIANRVERQRLLHQRKNKVCRMIFPEYKEDNHESFRYVVESCNRVGGNGTKSPRPHKKTKVSSKSKSSRDADDALIQHERAAIARLLGKYSPINEQTPSSSEPDRLWYQALELQFVFLHFEKMTNMRTIRSFPDPLERIGHFMDVWKNGMLMQHKWTKVRKACTKGLLYVTNVHYNAIT
jgi:hypothetical protein